MERVEDGQVSAASSASSSSLQLQKWIKERELLKERLITVDDFPWESPVQGLKYIGGVDLSFSKDDPSLACATLVVLDFQTLEIVHEDHSIVRVDVPYIPGFLAFREAPALLDLLEKVKNGSRHLYPQLLMVDGNGLLHPQGFGLACHLGVLADLPSIGIGKNLHHVDGLTLAGVKQLLNAKGNDFGNLLNLKGSSGCTWGVAMRSNPGSIKPIFISVGHCISLDTAVTIVQRTCKYRVPEPIRQADIRSRDYLKRHGMALSVKCFSIQYARVDL